MAEAARTSSPNSRGKTDPITALQDDIDGLSLAMFEALRSLRDAVAPDSGILGGNGNSDAAAGAAAAGSTGNSHGGEQADIEELWNLYMSGDKETVEHFLAANGGVVLQKREDFIRLHAKVEMEKDLGLVHRLAGAVLEKSQLIDERVDALPGMNRTKTEQLERIESLLGLNKAAVDDLEAAYVAAKERRDACRDYIRVNTCQSLTIDEDTSDAP